MAITVYKADGSVKGRIALAGSKSISNRVLIIRALCKEGFPIHHLANAKDTRLLLQLLQSRDETLDAGAAGTTFRFMTAFLAGQPGEQILTGTERMKQRPIGVLVDALRQLGARIDYLEKEGYPPLRIGHSPSFGEKSRLRIAAGTSSQYISALLLIAPTLSSGLQLELQGKVVSRPYIEMTLRMMQYFGVENQWQGNTITIAPQAYRARPFTVEADWSAASYFYAMAAIAGEAELQLDGLFKDSLQGDAVLADMLQHFGIKTDYREGGVLLSKSGAPAATTFRWDFLRCPDLAQTMAVLCGAKGITGQFTGLDTLRIKETDRIAALQAELGKVGVKLEPLATFPSTDEQQYYQVEGQAILAEPPWFETYEDHRMAMAFAAFALLGRIQVADPMVVVKSYPRFWEDLKTLGFTIA